MYRFALLSLATLFVLTPESIRAESSAASSLIAGPADFERLKRERDPAVRAILAELKVQANRALAQPPLARELEGRRLLETSRSLLQRMLLWGLFHQLDGDRKWAQRANQELLAVAAFTDWNDSHFLDAAEMAAGVAIGLDWFGSALPKETHATLHDALLRHALEPAAKSHGWKQTHNNWNQVCYGGLILAALTVRETHPQQAQRLLDEARSNLHHGLRPYAPDGLYPEGPMYWNYGTYYTLLTIEALRRNLGTDWDLPAQPGFLQSAVFMTHVFSPTGGWINFADCNDAPLAVPLLGWFARETHNPETAWFYQHRLAMAADQKRGLGREIIPALLWSAPTKDRPRPPTATSWIGRGPNPVAAHRSAWNDPRAAFVSLKGGGGNVNHGHLDAGALIVEADGVRWAHDPGMQSYHSLESRGFALWDRANGSARWNVFRLNNFSHTTLTINGKHHDATQLATLVRHAPGITIADLSGPLRLSSAQRGVHLRDDSLWIIDELAGLQPGDTVTWNWLTRTEVRISGDTATLRQDRRSLRIRSFAPADGQWSATPAGERLADHDAPMDGYTLLQWTATAAEDGTLHLPFTAAWTGTSALTRPTPLAEWKADPVSR